MRADLRTTHDPVELSRDELWHLQLDVDGCPLGRGCRSACAGYRTPASEIALVEERSFAAVDFDDGVAA